MSGYLAFDRERVSMLSRRLRDVVDRASRVPTGGDVPPTDAAQLRATRRALDAWSARLADVASSGAMIDRRPTGPGTGALGTAIWSAVAANAHMELALDPFGNGGAAAAGLEPAREAAALASALRSGDLDDLLAPDQLTELAGRLRGYAADSSARRAFVDGLGADGIRTIAEHLDSEWYATFDHRQVEQSPDRATELARVVSVLGSLGGVVAARHGDGGGPSPESVVQPLRPVIAAELVAGMGLAGNELARLADSILRRWWVDAASASPLALGTVRQPGDVLLPLIAADAAASRAFAPRVMDVPELLLRSTRDTWPVEAIVLQAADPAFLTVAQAGRVVPPLLAAVDRLDGRLVGVVEPSDHSWAWLASLAAGWLPQFVTRRDDWGWGPAEATAALRVALRDEDAPTVLAAHVSRGIEQVGDGAVTDPDALREAIREIAAIQAAVGELTLAEGMDDALRARAMWELGWSAMGWVVVGSLGAVMPAGAAGAAAAGVLTRAATGTVGEAAETAPLGVVDRARQLAERNGWLGAPPPIEVVEGDLLGALDRQTAQHAAAAVAFLAGELGPDRMPAAALGRVQSIAADAAADPVGPDAVACSGETTAGLLHDWLNEHGDSMSANDVELLRDSIDLLLAPGQVTSICVRRYA